MARLTEKLPDGTYQIPASILYLTNGMQSVIRKLAYYEDKQEQGRLIEVPVTIGETVYRINKGAKNPIIPMTVTSFEIKGMTNTFKKIKCTEIEFGGELCYRFTDIGNTVFFTQEEALAKMGE